MTQEEKQLLLVDLCGRLRYGIKVLDATFKEYGVSELINIGIDGSILVDNMTNDIQYYPIIDNIKPYLRPLSSMTAVEVEEYNDLVIALSDYRYPPEQSVDEIIDWLNSHHFDHRRLIIKGLALIAPEGMYETD